MKYEYVNGATELVVIYADTDNRYAIDCPERLSVRGSGPIAEIFLDLVTRIKELEAKAEIDQITMENFLGQLDDKDKSESLHEKLAARLELAGKNEASTMSSNGRDLCRDLAHILRSKP